MVIYKNRLTTFKSIKGRMILNYKAIIKRLIAKYIISVAHTAVD